MLLNKKAFIKNVMKAFFDKSFTNLIIFKKKYKVKQKNKIKNDRYLCWRKFVCS